MARRRCATAAIFRPAGDGPFPVVVYLHEADGLTAAQLALGSPLAASGFVVIMGCRTPTRAAVTCPKLPEDPIPGFIELGLSIPGARKGPVGLVGVSTGGSLALYEAARRDDIGAVVADSGFSLADVPRAPVLILESELDEKSVVADARTYERTLKERGVIVEAKFYPNGGHRVLYSVETKDDAMRTASAFLTKYLSP